MHTLKQLKISAPAAKSQISGADQQMTFIIANKRGNLGVKYASWDFNWLYFVFLAGAPRPLLTQGSANAATSARINELWAPPLTNWSRTAASKKERLREYVVKTAFRHGCAPISSSGYRT
jgi:hypothetical protein